MLTRNRVIALAGAAMLLALPASASAADAPSTTIPDSGVEAPKRLTLVDPPNPIMRRHVLTVRVNGWMRADTKGGQQVKITLRGKPNHMLACIMTNSLGSGQTIFRLPETTTPGRHVLVATSGKTCASSVSRTELPRRGAVHHFTVAPGLAPRDVRLLDAAKLVRHNNRAMVRLAIEPRNARETLTMNSRTVAMTGEPPRYTPVAFARIFDVKPNSKTTYIYLPLTHKGRQLLKANNTLKIYSQINETGTNRTRTKMFLLRQDIATTQAEKNLLFGR